LQRTANEGSFTNACRKRARFSLEVIVEWVGSDSCCRVGGAVFFGASRTEVSSGTSTPNPPCESHKHSATPVLTSTKPILAGFNDILLSTVVIHQPLGSFKGSDKYQLSI
jgi:hypothetical protein